LILVLLAGFCLGVERGKSISGEPAQRRPAAPSPMIARERAPAAREYLPKVATAERVIPAPVVAINRTSTPQNVAAPAQGGDGLYAIQLASYVGAEAAQAEAARVKRLGFTPRVIKQGKFFELRVVGFRSREEASGSLATLKKTYHDSFIKKVTS
jgi:cell division septation protein DedD